MTQDTQHGPAVMTSGLAPAFDGRPTPDQIKAADAVAKHNAARLARVDAGSDLVVALVILGALAYAFWPWIELALFKAVGP